MLRIYWINLKKNNPLRFRISKIVASFLFSALGSTFFAKKHGLWGFYFWSFSSTTVAGHDSTIFGDFRWSFWGHETYAASTETLGIRIEALRLPYVGVLPRIPGTEEITIDILLVQKLLRDHHWWWSNHTYRPCRVKKHIRYILSNFVKSYSNTFQLQELCSLSRG